MPYHTMDPSQAIERILEAKGLSEEDDTDIMYQYTIFRRIRKEEKSVTKVQQHKSSASKLLSL